MASSNNRVLATSLTGPFVTLTFVICPVIPFTLMVQDIVVTPTWYINSVLFRILVSNHPHMGQFIVPRKTPKIPLIEIITLLTGLLNLTGTKF